ncbi:DUF4870 domain-containing protein [Aureisphaera galaxeae]|uniref:DUF4870 domain-containing protein n=1 Tax=Aureisphaera galaxeae TaxID=1538023 RepID=UPI002350CB94|nr:DUF4870 domain-containing protein [Aureisphaera galaxeae]MDC8003519.1 DUF4870 domain-containing protein [Aureisphaera galaxeae]
METTPTENEKNVAAAMHLSTFTKYIFPFGNFLAPLLLWTTNKDKPFVREHGRQAINFQLSILLYSLAIGIVCLPFFVIFASDFTGLVEVIDDHVHDITIRNVENLSSYLVLFLVVAVLLFGVFVFELYCVIQGTLHANKGQLYKYPLSIQFIKINEDEQEQEEESQSSINQSENEHVS